MRQAHCSSAFDERMEGAGWLASNAQDIACCELPRVANRCQSHQASCITKQPVQYCTNRLSGMALPTRSQELGTVDRGTIVKSR